MNWINEVRRRVRFDEAIDSVVGRGGSVKQWTQQTV